MGLVVGSLVEVLLCIRIFVFSSYKFSLDPRSSEERSRKEQVGGVCVLSWGFLISKSYTLYKHRCVARCTTVSL